MAPPNAELRRSPSWPRLALTGVVGGAFSGLFGIGGGIVMVPLLVLLAGLDQRRASAMSLAAIIPTAAAGSLGYLAGGALNLLAAGLVAAGGVVGSVIGAMILRRISLAWLRWLFIAMLVGVAIRMALLVPERGEAVSIDVAAGAGLVVLGLVMGVAAGLFGVGGGVIAVPALIAIFGMSDLVAKGTSLLVMIPTAIAGSVPNLRARLVDVRDALVVGAAATVASIGGVALAFLIPPAVSSILFAVLVIASAAQLAVRAIRQHGRERGGEQGERR